MAGGDLFAQQIAFQMRVLALGRGGGFVIQPAMVAARETGDGIDMRPHQRIGEFVRVEASADAADVLAGVEIEVNLAVAQLAQGCLRHGGFLPSSALSVIRDMKRGRGRRRSLASPRAPC